MFEEMCFIWWLCKCNKVKLCSNTWKYANMLLEELPHQWAKIWAKIVTTLTENSLIALLTVPLLFSRSAPPNSNSRIMNNWSFSKKSVKRRKNLFLFLSIKKNWFLLHDNLKQFPVTFKNVLHKKWIVRAFSIIALMWAEFEALNQVLNINLKLKQTLNRWSLALTDLVCHSLNISPVQKCPRLPWIQEDSSLGHNGGWKGVSTSKSTFKMKEDK